MARNIFINTLNSIRSSLHTKGRDVAEAFDAVDQKVGELQKQIYAIKPTQVFAAAPAQAPRPLPSIAPAAGASQPYAPPVTPTLAMVSGNYTMIGSDVEIQVTSPGICTIQLKAGTVNPTGQMVTVKNYSASGVVITIQDSAGGTIDNASNIQMTWQNTAATFTWDGVSNWAVS